MTAAVTDAPENLTDDALFAADDDEFANAPPEPDDDDTTPPGPDLAPDADAPFGYVIDRKTGQRRPKMARGRPRAAAELTAGPPVDAAPDEPPAPSRRRGRAPAAAPVPPPAAADGDVPMPKSGVIARKVDKLYRRAGKLVRVWNAELGEAFIASTRPDDEDPDEPTVGQAWENLAQGNPRVRAWLVNLIRSGDWQELIFAHAPIGVAVVTSTWVGRLIPLGRLVESMLEPDEDSEEGDLLPEDAADMMETAQAQAQRIASKMGVKVPPEVARQAMAQAQQHAARMGILTPPYDQHNLAPDEASGNGAGPPRTATRRQQPKATSRAQRRH